MPGQEQVVVAQWVVFYFIMVGWGQGDLALGAAGEPVTGAGNDLPFCNKGHVELFVQPENRDLVRVCLPQDGG